MFDIAQLAHVEILTPEIERSLWFFKELLGMDETARVEQSVYLRAYEEFYHHSLKITEAAQPGLGHVAWRCTSPQALQRRAQAIEGSDLGRGWVEGELGHGPAYQFATPAGHLMEILWEVEYYQAAGEARSGLLNRPQRRPLRGVPVRRIDHINLGASEVSRNREFLMDYLGFRLRERRVLNDGTEAGVWLSVSPLVHEIAVMRATEGHQGGLNHICYWYGYPQHLWDSADVFRENGIRIRKGPSKHGISQALCLYVYEPGGNVVELFGDVGYLIFDPDWKPITWTETEDDRSFFWL
jgi:catechol 2,3-dioxygenase